ncbi:MAG: hypothetical protein ABIP93_00335 [Gemmatimonadaceae bacterium]
MHAPALALLIALAGPVLPADTGRLAIDPFAPGVPSRLELPVSLQLVEDTVPRRRPKSIEVSEWYERRLRIHRYGAYTMIPLFTFQAIAGNQIYTQSSAAPGWAKAGHRVGATGLATVFGVNTVTGLWNLWDSRSVPQGRTRRTIHTLLMLASDAGFTYAGVRLSEQAENSADKRREHRQWAYGSMATALAGAGVMVFSRDK